LVYGKRGGKRKKILPANKAGSPTLKKGGVPSVSSMKETSARVQQKKKKKKRKKNKKKSRLGPKHGGTEMTVGGSVERSPKKHVGIRATKVYYGADWQNFLWASCS